MASYWVKNIKIKKGSLHEQLGISKDKGLPVSLLKKILNSKIGDKVDYLRRSIKITRLLKKRVNLALNLRKMRK